LRKSLLVAGTATLALGAAGIAYAQTPAPSIEASVGTSPGKAGTKSKPKNVTFKLSVKNDPASRTTASKITITLPSTLKLSTSGQTLCKAADDEIVSSNGAVCKKSNVGKGTASAVILSNNTTVNFKVTPLVAKKEVLFFLTSSQIANKYVVHGKISGRKMTITIPPDVQQPLQGLYAALIDINATLGKKKGKNYLFSTTGCKSKKHKVGVKVDYADNPTPPSARSASTTANAKCS
jgi:hypothetical protein